METEYDDDKKVITYSNVKRLVKRFNDDRQSDNAELEGETSGKEYNDDDFTENSTFKTDKPINDEEPTDDLDEQEVYASAEENDDSENETSKQACEDQEAETKLRVDIDNESVEDDNDNTFRRSFRTIRRTRNKRPKTSDTDPEDMSGEVEDVQDGVSIDYDSDDGVTVRTVQAKRQQPDADDTEANNNLNEQKDSRKYIYVDNDNLCERKYTIDGSEDELNDDTMKQDDGTLYGNDDTNDNLSENTRSNYSKSDDVASDKEEDEDVDSAKSLRDEGQDTASSDNGGQNILEDVEENATIEYDVDSITGSFRTHIHHSNVGETGVDSNPEQDDESIENHDNDGDSTVQDELKFTHTNNLYSFTFNDPMKDLKALTGRIVKDAMVFQQPSEQESNKYYEDENELQEIVESTEPTAEVSEEQEEPENLEAHLQPEEYSDPEEDLVEAEITKDRASDLRVNTKALSKAAQTYELEHFEKNSMVIFHQESIPGYERRKGSRKDAADLISTFEKFGFEMQEHLDPTKDEIFRNLEEFAATDFSDFGCVAVAIMTHGSTRGCLRAKDRKYYETDIINYFKTHNNPTLVTKPKIIIIQACRGKKTNPAVPVNQRMILGKIAKDHDDHDQYTLPTESDILVLHSTYAGNPSHRDETYGTWFIQTLCKKIKELAHELDLESIFTEVQREVAIDKEHKEWNIDTKKDEIGKQMPVKMSTLIRKLHLYDKDFARHNPEVQTQIHRDMEMKAIVRRDSSASGISSADTFTPCACFLDKFVYLRDCMRYFVQDNPDDKVAQSYLDIAESFEDVTEFNKSKEKISKAIVSHLKDNAEKCEFYKFLNL